MSQLGNDPTEEPAGYFKSFLGTKAPFYGKRNIIAKNFSAMLTHTEQGKWFKKECVQVKIFDSISREMVWITIQKKNLL